MSFDSLLTIARLTVADRPLLPFAVTTAMAYGVIRLRRRAAAPSERTTAATRSGWLLAGVVLLLVGAVLVAYQLTASYDDAAEPTIAAVAWLFWRGEPVYHAAGDAVRYSHMYGPLAFMAPAAFMAITGAGIASSKAFGILVFASSAVAVGLTVRRRGANWNGTLCATAVFVVLALSFRQTAFWIRPDSSMLLIAAVAMLATTLDAATGAAVLLGVCAGVIVNFKITGPLYVLPAVAAVAPRLRPRDWTVLVLTAAAVAAAPFTLTNVSLSNYLGWVRLSAGNGLEPRLLWRNVQWMLFLAVPLTLVGAIPRQEAQRRGLRRVIAAVAAAMPLVAIAASKPGAGPYHLLPFVPAIVVAAAEGVSVLPRRHATRALTRAVAFSFLAVAVSTALVQQVYLFRTAATVPSRAVVEDLQRSLATIPTRSVAMGFSGDNERYTFIRPLLVFRGGPYLIDAPAVQEYQLSGMLIPEATEEALARCAVSTWLFPRGAQPFTGMNKYARLGYPQLFPEAFKRTFHQHYVHTGTSEFFDVWSCAARSP